MSVTGVESDKKTGWTAGLGALGAVLASACCILPLAFLMLGISGSWISTLTLMDPYKNYFAAIALVFLGLGFRQVYFIPKKQCEEDSYCATPQSNYVIKTSLWVSTLLVLSALTIDLWAPVLGEYI
jgi:mercuric ion transport protein